MCWLFEKTNSSLLRSIWVKKNCALIPLRRDGHGVEFIILRQNNVSSISVVKHIKEAIKRYSPRKPRFYRGFRHLYGKIPANDSAELKGTFPL